MLKNFVRLLGLLVVIAVMASGWAIVTYQRFLSSPLATGSQGMHYDIKPGMGLMEVAQDLEDRGVLKHWYYLLAAGQWQGRAHLIKAGEYEFATNITPQQLLDQIIAGRVLEHPLTIVEGWTFRQFMEAVNHNAVLVHELTGLSDGQIMDAIGWKDQQPEGRFYPDTYRFPKGMSDIAFLKRSYRAMSDHLDAEWQAREPGLPLATPYQALILASIVERETALPGERKLIAGVFIRRLRKNMRLQTDPTVIYGMGNAYAGNISKRDLGTDTPFNTYVHSGLPPTPIALPGADALHATLHPEPGDSLYFVARGNGSHQFSDTLEEHNRAVAKFQLRPHTVANDTLLPPKNAKNFINDSKNTAKSEKNAKHAKNEKRAGA